MSVSGKAIIFSAPSGSGKTTVAKYLLTTFPSLAFSISACTRPPRGEMEVHGKDYYFLSIEDFRAHIKNDDFIEWEEVYAGNYYGTLIKEVERLWKEGKTVVFDVDVKGGVNLKKYFGDKALSIFVQLPSLEELERRLRSRGTEDEKSIKKRLYKAEFELGFKSEFDTVLINDKLEDTFAEAEKLVNDFMAK